MKIAIILIIILAVIFYLIFIRNGKLSFWRKVAKNPDKAFTYFSTDEAWLIDTEGNIEVDKNKWEGPFRLYVPLLGTSIKIYGKKDKYEESQKRILKKLK